MTSPSLFKMSKLIQRLSIFGLVLLLTSVPIQISIFSSKLDIVTVNNNLESLKADIPESSISDVAKKNEITLQSIESQKSKVKALKIPLPVVKAIKAATPTSPKVEPTAKPENTNKEASQGDPSVQELKSLITTNCAKYSCDSDQLIRVMMCESGGTNHRNTYYKGPFQFLTSTFYANAKRVGIANADVLDARQQVQVASYMFGIGQAKQWGCK